MDYIENRFRGEAIDFSDGSIECGVVGDLHVSVVDCSFQ